MIVDLYLFMACLMWHLNRTLHLFFESLRIIILFCYSVDTGNSIIIIEFISFVISKNLD